MVYPRVCGGTVGTESPGGISAGLSPRVRGNQCPEITNAAPLWSIPACAGEPGVMLTMCGMRAVYPRVCGGTAQRTEPNRTDSGLSPRVRGNRGCHHPVGVSGGSIPACAGEPSVSGLVTRRGGVYPRVCGGTRLDGTFINPAYGLSPRVRGNQKRQNPVEFGARSIPACAGEPGPLWPTRTTGWVYPRVCGGTGAPINPTYPAGGLSPRVRGNHRPRRRVWQSNRSIPACAGEPSGGANSNPGGEVYPRVCGGTQAGLRRPSPPEGLSPRVRGNPPHPVPARPVPRSIPACAGEPMESAVGLSVLRVYPRVCGGTLDFAQPGSPIDGLSPRVRGNLRTPTRSPGMWGSIPACAGEPHTAEVTWETKGAGEPSTYERKHRRAGVYPRVCGGTQRRTAASAVCGGLSPRVRGNPCWAA